MSQATGSSIRRSYVLDLKLVEFKNYVSDIFMLPVCPTNCPKFN